MNAKESNFNENNDKEGIERKEFVDQETIVLILHDENNKEKNNDKKEDNNNDNKKDIAIVKEHLHR